MPNILFTQSCVRSCPYCFAKRHMSEASPEDILSWENLIYIADLMQAAGDRGFSILGGEPTLHPDFNDMVCYLLERNFNVRVFTSGIMAERKLEEAFAMFGHLPLDRLGFICNINDPKMSSTPLAETECLRRFLRMFNARITAGFNIYHPEFSLDFLFQYINEFGLNRHVRLGLAHPIWGKQNKYVPVQKLEAIIDRIFAYIPLFDSLKIKPALDCGFPLCKLKDDQLAWLTRATGGKFDFGCGPVLDIGPDMSVWSCFPLSSFHKRSLFEFDSIHRMFEYYQGLHNAIKVEAGGIYDECDYCKYREDGACRGGCAAHNLNRFQKEPRVRIPEVYG